MTSEYPGWTPDFIPPYEVNYSGIQPLNPLHVSTFSISGSAPIGSDVKANAHIVPVDPNILEASHWQ
jgi:hypothetical protein